MRATRGRVLRIAALACTTTCAVAVAIAPAAAEAPAKAKGLRFKVKTEQDLTGEIHVATSKDSGGHKITSMLFQADTLMDCGGFTREAGISQADEVDRGSSHIDLIYHLDASTPYHTAYGGWAVFGKFTPGRRGHSLPWTRASGRLKQYSVYDSENCTSGRVDWHTTNVRPWSP